MSHLKSNLRPHRVRINGRRGLFYSIALYLITVGIGGAGFWFLEPTVHHNYGQGLWLAFTTAATVGYGDIIPSTTASRIFAVVVVLMGLAVISLVTASVSALFAYVPDDNMEIDRTILKEIIALRQEIEQIKTSLQNAQLKNK